MNLVDKLLKMDAKKAEELQTGSVESKRLAKLLGVDKVEVQIREIKSRRVNDIVAYQIDQKGKFDYSKSYDAKLMMCVEGIVEPDLRNKDLQAHFECKRKRRDRPSAVRYRQFRRPANVDATALHPPSMAHFECKSAKDLCEKLFGMEITEISDAISLLSGVDTEEDHEETVKN